MARSSWFAVLCSVISLLLGISTASTPDTGNSGELLREHWSIQSSADVHADGAAISTIGFVSRDWYPATLPSTILSALVQDQVYPDPYTGMNLRSIPGT